MPDERYGLPLPVTGDLDTANPIGNRVLGTLVEAEDLSGRFWGPREGSQAFTRAWEGPGTASLYDQITLQASTDTYGLAQTYETQFRDLGTQFTLDLWIRSDGTAYATGNSLIGIYNFRAGSIGEIFVYLLADGAGANEGKILVTVVTSETLVKADPPKSITSTNVISTGSEQDKKHHIRLVRDGTDMELFIDGVSEGTNATLLNSPINAAVDAPSTVSIGYTSVADISFQGDIYGAVLRAGAYDSLPIEGVMPHNPWAPNVHHYILGRNIDFGGGDDHYFDAGRFAVHPRIIGSSYTVTSSNDDTAPAPAIVQGMRTWTTRTNRTATSVMVGGALSTSTIG